MTEISDKILQWYEDHGRKLPWRGHLDPYAVWVSEIMLQQTRVETVIPYFERWMIRFPSIADLANATEGEVLSIWEGLGYYSRARNLHKAARKVVTELHGEMPDNEAALRELPGVGAYTAAAIASISFGARAAAVDGNLVRVLARVFALPGRASDPSLVRAVRAQAQALVNCRQPGEVNQSLMDIGATLCRPEAPLCTQCPLRKFCKACGEEDPAVYPEKAAKTARKSLAIVFAWIEHEGALLLEQRPLDGLWPGLWEMPSASGAGAKQVLAKRLGQPLGPLLARVSHELTHRHVVAWVYQAKAQKQGEQRWWRDPLSAPLSSLARKAIVAAKLARGSGR